MPALVDTKGMFLDFIKAHLTGKKLLLRSDTTNFTTAKTKRSVNIRDT